MLAAEGPVGIESCTARVPGAARQSLYSASKSGQKSSPLGNAPCQMVGTSTAIAFHGRKSRCVKSTARRWGARSKSTATSGVGAVASKVAKAAAVLMSHKPGCTERSERKKRT